MTHAFLARIAAAATVLAAAVAAQAELPQLSYRLTPIVPPGGQMFAGPGDIDNAGRIAGATFDAFAVDNQAYLRQPDGTFIDLQPIAGQSFTDLNRLAARGRVVGLSGTSETDARAAMWDRSGNVTDVGVLPGASFGLANDADWFGTVIGSSGDANFAAAKAFMWRRGRIREVPIDGFEFASLEAFGSFGRIAGTGWNTPVPFTDTEGFIRDRRGNVERIGLLDGGTISALVDMNWWGTAVGFADDGDGIQNAIYYAHGRIRSRGTLPDHVFAEFAEINNLGSAVGVSGPPMGPPSGVVSFFGGPLVDINTMLDPVTGAGWHVFACVAINDRTQIMAVAADLSGPPLPVSVLLTPFVDRGMFNSGSGSGPAGRRAAAPPKLDPRVYERFTGIRRRFGR